VIIPRLAEVGGKTCGTSVGRAPQPKSEAQLDAQAEILEKIVRICESYGVVLNLHNHTYEVENQMHDLRSTLSRLHGIPLGPDLNWLIRGGVDPVEFIREFGSRIVFLHLRDQNANGTWSEALGEGITDFRSIAVELQQVGFSGPAIIELAHENGFEPTRPLRESLMMSRSFIKTVFGY
jgi:sugar phosphate isomerase/epimerase